jgi:hypothetical protein
MEQFGPMRWLGLACILFLPGCLQIGTGNDADAGASSAAASAAASYDAGGDVAATGGSGCGVDSVSGATLCTRIDQCPGLAVDHDAYPDCGFRVPSTTIDLECVCGDFLCPLGAALSCDQAATLLSEQSEIAACTQQNEGRCAARATSPKPETSCDMSCAQACAGDINCRTLCGC